MIVDNLSHSLEEKVYFSLEEEILSGRLKSGESLTEVALSRRLGVSRTPLRSALARLSEEGLVRIVPNKGAVVLGVSDDDLVDIYKIRLRLEGLAAREAAARRTDGDIRRLSESVELSEFYIQKNDTEHLKELDGEFHGIIYEISANRLLCKTLTELHKSIKKYRKLSLSSPDRLINSTKEHREILRAIERGDGDEADRLTTLHVEAALKNLTGILKN